MTFGLRLILESEKEGTTVQAVATALVSITNKFRGRKGITAYDAVVQLMEATCLLPGVFNVQMLGWRQKLQMIVHNPSLPSGRLGLQYELKLSKQVAENLPLVKTVATQTNIVNPNQPNLLEFQTRNFELVWALSKS